MDYFAALRAFVRSVDLGSFSKAAAEQKVKVSTVSRYVSALETDLGAAILNRSTRRLHLTEAGSALYDRASRILMELDETRSAVQSLNKQPQGRLRVTAPGAFGRHHVVPHLSDFLALYPDIRVDLTLTDTIVQIIEAGEDVAVRIGALPDSTLIAKMLAPNRRFPVASPGLISARPPMLGPRDLEQLECLSFSLRQGQAWFYRRPGGEAPDRLIPSGRLSLNDSEALLSAAERGIGVALLPTWLTANAIAEGRLVGLLTDWNWSYAPGPDQAIWGVYPPKKVVAPKVRAFIDFLAGRFGSPPYWDRRLPGLTPVRPPGA